MPCARSRPASNLRPSPIISRPGSRSRAIRRLLVRARRRRASHPQYWFGLMTAVTCPIMRYHAAIVAQAAATIALLSNNRFTLGLGSGERLNEHVIGGGWPGNRERHERLSEAIDIIKGLLAGDLQHYQGTYFKLDHARVFDRPEQPPSLAIAAGGEEAARLAGRKGAALVTTEPSADFVEAYGFSGGTAPR